MTGSTATIRVGTGAGFFDDRFEPARDLTVRGAVDCAVAGGAIVSLAQDAHGKRLS